MNRKLGTTRSYHPSMEVGQRKIPHELRCVVEVLRFIAAARNQQEQAGGRNPRMKFS